jgi:tRNA(fMet)-specific endonuclease VapC
MGPTLLDTDILSEVIKQRDPAVRRRALVHSRQHGQLVFSAVTRYEVTRGYRWRGAATQLQRFEKFCSNSLALPVTNEIWDRAADLWAMARRSGLSHNDADLLIAATALEHGLSLATANLRRFAWVPSLSLDDWRV